MKKEEKTLNTTSIIVQMLLNILFYGIAIFVTITCANVAYDFAYQIYGEVTVSEAPGKTKKIDIKEGMSAMQVADKLDDNNLIVNKYSFLVKFKLSEAIIKPGEYEISNSDNYTSIINKISGVDSEESA